MIMMETLQGIITSTNADDIDMDIGKFSRCKLIDTIFVGNMDI